jgi:hypothetical protein
MKLSHRILMLLLAVGVVAFLVGDRRVRANPPEGDARAARAFELTTRLELALAEKELEGADPELPNVAIAKARLAIYSGDCDGAVALLSRPELTADDDARGLADLARGCARVTAANVVLKDEARAIEVKFQDEHDAALFPLLAETIDRARTMLTNELGVDWPKPTRFVVVRDHLALSAMTGLPYESAKTTGTVAVAKWGKVTFLSPRASHHGYPWRDTVTHELTHMAITRASADRAPLWLQEGLAKRQEVRWRPPGPFDDRPSVESVVIRGIEQKLDLPLDKLGPSIAMLPSADAAMVAFAEVSSFVRYFVDHSAKDMLPKLFTALKNGQTVDEALRSVTTKDLPAWDQEWRAWLKARPKEPLSALYGLGKAPKNLREAREKLRLAELLLDQGQALAARRELTGVGVTAAGTPDELGLDPSVRSLQGRVLEALDKRDEAFPLVSEPKDVATSFAPWWALRGRVVGARGDTVGAEASYAEGIGEDPFDPEVSCVNAQDPLCTANRVGPSVNTANPLGFSHASD